MGEFPHVNYKRGNSPIFLVNLIRACYLAPASAGRRRMKKPAERAGEERKTNADY